MEKKVQDIERVENKVENELKVKCQERERTDLVFSVSEMYFFFLGSWGSQDSLRLKLIINSRRQTRNGLSDTLIVH